MYNYKVINEIRRGDFDRYEMTVLEVFTKQRHESGRDKDEARTKMKPGFSAFRKHIVLWGFRGTESLQRPKRRPTP